MKLKHIAAAALLAATGASHAAIDTGATGNGDLFFNIWDGARSYTVDLNVTIDAFEAGVAAAGSFNFGLNLAADTLFQNFIGTANVAELVWNIVANDSQGARRVIETYATLPEGTIGNGDARTMSSSIQSFAGLVNTGMAAQGSANSAVFAAGLPGYANNPGGQNPLGTNHDGLLNFSNGGTLANNSYASGMNLLRINIAASGVAPSVYTSYADDGFAVRAYIDSGYGLTISAVPEPETYALLLAGLGLMGSIARRRSRKQA